jgi:hypothetical protein
LKLIILSLSWSFSPLEVDKTKEESKGAPSLRHILFDSSKKTNSKNEMIYKISYDNIIIHFIRFVKRFCE